jgi:hypothetical protein
MASVGQRLECHRHRRLDLPTGAKVTQQGDKGRVWGVAATRVDDS